MITQEDIRKFPGAEFYNLGVAQAKGVSTDSRATMFDMIFFALRGEKFDGHNFVRDAIGQKAACAVVDRKWYGTAVGRELFCRRFTRLSSSTIRRVHQVNLQEFIAENFLCP